MRCLRSRIDGFVWLASAIRRLGYIHVRAGNNVASLSDVVRLLVRRIGGLSSGTTYDERKNCNQANRPCLHGIKRPDVLE